MGLPDAHGYNGEDGLSFHIEGARGEIAFGKASGRYWSPSVNTFSLPDFFAEDLKLGIQVRRRSREDYELLVRPVDFQKNPTHAYVHITGAEHRFTLRGYRICRDCARDEWKQAHGGRPPAWFVPNKDLWPVTDLFVTSRSAYGQAAAS